MKICLPPSLQYILIKQGQDNFNGQTHVERKNTGWCTAILKHQRMYILRTYPGDGERSLCLLALPPFLCLFSINHSKHLPNLVSLSTRHLFDSLIFTIFWFIFISLIPTLYYLYTLLNLGFMCSSSSFL